MDAGLQKVADFIVKSAITAFNAQYNFTFDWRKYQINSLPAHEAGHCAFEICNYVDDERLKLHIYGRLTGLDIMGDFILCDDVNNPSGPGELVYIATAQFSDEILTFNTNEVRRQCPNFPSIDSQLNCLIDEYFIHAIASEDGGYILFEDGTPLAGLV